MAEALPVAPPPTTPPSTAQRCKQQVCPSPPPPLISPLSRHTFDLFLSPLFFTLEKFLLLLLCVCFGPLSGFCEELDWFSRDFLFFKSFQKKEFIHCPFVFEVATSEHVIFSHMSLKFCCFNWFSPLQTSFSCGYAIVLDQLHIQKLLKITI
jgi:hypothetical protein